MLFSDLEGGGNSFAIVIDSHIVRHLIWANTKNSFQLIVSVRSLRGLRVLWFSEFSMRKINIYSANIEINSDTEKKSETVTTATEPTNKQVQKKNYGKHIRG